MQNILEAILYPIIWVMQFVLGIINSIIPSTGFSILLLSFLFALAALPLRKKAEILERHVGAKMSLVEKEVKDQRGALKGEKLFLLTEKIYKKHNYHPIQSVYMGASFFVMLPVLISAILLFSGETLAGKSYLLINDLSQPDHLFGIVNVLPIVMSSITVIDARLRFASDRKARIRFYVVAAVMLLIVHSMASGLVLYWTGSNVISLVMSNWKIFIRK